MTARAQKPVSNLDESKVGPYTLPDPLVLADGRKVVTSAQWNQERRPELLHLFETHMYGKVPRARQTDPAQVSGQIGRPAGPGWYRHPPRSDRSCFPRSPTVRGSTSCCTCPRRPATATRVPAFLGMNFRGNQTIHPDPGITLFTTVDAAEQQRCREKPGDRVVARNGLVELAGRANPRPRLRTGDILLRRHRPGL